MLATVLPLLALASAARASSTSQTSLSGSYAPTPIECPGNKTWIRPASGGLNSQEAEWLTKRRAVVVPALQSYLSNANVSGLDVEAYISAIQNDTSRVPTISITLSGGGQRSEFCSLALVQAMDARYQPALQAKTGGLLQAATYQSGLSGGSFATAVLGLSSYAPIQTLLENGNFNLTGPSDEAYAELAGKGELGLPITVSDFFGISQVYNIGRSLTNQSADPLSFTWSGIQANPAFQNGSMPMPIQMISEVRPEGIEGANVFESVNGTILLGTEDAYTYYEATPFEFGSWQGRVKAFTDVAYFGTNMSAGMPVNSSECLEGYDSAAFVTGVCISAINLWLAQSTTNGTVGQFAKRQSSDNSSIPGDVDLPYPANEDTIEQMRVNAGTSEFVANFIPVLVEQTNQTIQDLIYGIVPNPFYNVEGMGVNEFASAQDYLFLVDGSENGEENPIWPVIQPARSSDFIVVSDNGGTELSSGWMNGTSLLNTYESTQRAGLKFPRIPSVRTMMNLGHTKKPTFYGCNAEPDVPLVLYIADNPYTAYTNLSFIQDEISNGQLEMIFENGFAAMTQNNNQLTENWSDCLACGAVYKSMQKMGMEIPETCRTCMSEHCWQGNEDNSQPRFYAPYLRLNTSLSWSEWNSSVWSNA